MCDSKEVHLSTLGGREARQVCRVVIDQAQEALQPRAAVVRSLALVAMRQQQHQPGLLAPTLTPCKAQSTWCPVWMHCWQQQEG